MNRVVLMAGVSLRRCASRDIPLPTRDDGQFVLSDVTTAAGDSRRGASALIWYFRKDGGRLQARREYLLACGQELEEPACDR